MKHLKLLGFAAHLHAFNAEGLQMIKFWPSWQNEITLPDVTIVRFSLWMHEFGLSAESQFAFEELNKIVHSSLRN